MGAGHVSLGPGFVDENQPTRIYPALVLAPLLAAPADVRLILLAGDERPFF
jgi:hypothetical protein